MSLPPSELIKIKRDKKELTSPQIKGFIADFVSGTVTDYQMSAFLMAVTLNGMTKKETIALTEAMLHSGKVVDLSSLKGLKIDKHSTGGVGDKTSLIIGPIVAEAGVKVPMISGRGLGHTGGTLDKLESIPGFSTQLTLEQFVEQIEQLGICYIGQTREICPADKRMYAIRDVTATVESRELICASIMSKKLAEGIDGLVLDIKVGSGAFMKTPKEARDLAKGLIEIAKSAGKKVTAFITNMSQPLGKAIGNALEVEECLDVLKNHGPEDLKNLSLELSAEMIHMGGRAKTLKAARNLAEEILQSGKALRRFQDIVAAQGGKLPVPKALNSLAVVSPKSGYIRAMNTEKIGVAAILLGAGRLCAEDPVDPSAGIVLHFKIGEKIKKGNALATLHFNDDKPMEEITKMLTSAIQISLQKCRSPRLIIKNMGH